MNTRILAALALGCALTGTALADTVVIGDKVTVRESQMATPKRGSTMSDVERHFGAPTDKHPTVMAALAARDKAAYDLAQTTVKAPADGVISQASSFKVGQYVGSGDRKSVV